MSDAITWAFTLMIRVGDMITVEVRLDESKVRVEAIQLAGRSVTLTVSLSERANL